MSEADDNSLWDFLRSSTANQIKEHFREQDVNSLDEHGLAPLHILVTTPRVDIPDLISLFVSELNADVNIKTPERSETPLHIALNEAHFSQLLPVARSLLDHGADTEYRDSGLRTPYDIALEKNLSEVVALLLQASSRDEPTTQVIQTPTSRTQKTQRDNISEELIDAVIHGQRDQVDKLLEENADPNHINKYGAGALHYTVTHYVPDKGNLLELLISCGADVNLTDHEGDTALNLVVKINHLRHDDQMASLAKILLGSGTDATIRDIDGKNAFDLARAHQYLDILDLLEGRSWEAEDTSAQEEPFGGSPECIDSIQNDEEGEDEPDTTDNVENDTGQPEGDQDLNTPLHLAVMDNDILAVKKLLEEKPDIRAKNGSGETPADMAKRFQFQDIYDHLEEYRRAELEDKLKRGAKKASVCSTM